MVYFSMKRAREGDAMVDDYAITTMANCLMLLSRGSSPPAFEEEASSPSRVFECKTCNRQFSSFQALGGHRASHKKPRFIMGSEGHQAQLQSLAAVVKPKTHECSICGLEFAIGQALGGHMRRHRAALIEQNHAKDSSVNVVDVRKVLAPPSPVVKKANSRRVFSLDLNLTPLENDHLEFGLGKNMAHAIDLY